jgi:hypothetical protein
MNDLALVRNHVVWLIRWAQRVINFFLGITKCIFVPALFQWVKWVKMAYFDSSDNSDTCVLCDTFLEIVLFCE